MLTLHNLKSKGVTKSGKRIGRGDSSGAGSYSGKGRKGQKARAGTSNFSRRGLKQFLFQIPKMRGFNARFDKREIINLSVLNELPQSVITPEVLLEAGVISTVRPGIKVLGQGTLTKKLTVHAHEFSASAKTAIEAQGGKVIMLPDARTKKRESKLSQK